MLTLSVVEIKSGFRFSTNLTTSTFPPIAAQCNTLVPFCKMTQQSRDHVLHTYRYITTVHAISSLCK